ncbi:MAG: accessory gene regulator B family protein, partial [Lachnospiraceae bacterium]|nr:accessory gene regulator B family protein [Lachnospiraceae bacterium]
ICMFLTNRIRKEMPDIDDERAEIINYGLQNVIGEIPKTFLVLAIAYFLGIWKETLITFLLLAPFKSASGGFHLKTHLGCTIITTMFYCGVPMLAKFLILSGILKYIIIASVWIFGMCMIKLYAPADTENVPILRKKDRKRQQIISYIIFSIGMLLAISIQYSAISNIIILGYFLQTLMITKLAYRLTNNKYGYEIYDDSLIQNV